MHALKLMALMTLCACAGCAGDAYRSLAAEQDVPRLAELRRAGDALPERTVIVPTHATAPARPDPVGVAVHETGSGSSERVLVLLHGLMSDSDAWRFMRAPLGARCDLWAVDLPGCGGSRIGPSASVQRVCTPTELSRRVLLALRARLAERNGATPRLTFVGHSLGGMLMLRMTADPALRAEFADVLRHVDGMVLITPVDVAIEKEQPVFRELATVTPLEVALGDVTGILPRRIAGSTCDGVCAPGPALREEADRSLEILRDPARRRAMQATIRQAVPFHAGRPDWPRIEAVVAEYHHVDVPCLIVWGARDELFPCSMGYKLAAQVPGARLEILPESMHCLTIERPEACATLIKDFVAEGPPRRDLAAAAFGLALGKAGGGRTAPPRTWWSAPLPEVSFSCSWGYGSPARRTVTWPPTVRRNGPAD